jgi:hypothetical protein
MDQKEAFMMRIWHYTVGVHLPGIMRSGEIRCATAFVPESEKPLVWFSTNPLWEETANKMYKDILGTLHEGNKETTAKIGEGLIRIEVSPDAAPYSWKDFKKKKMWTKKIIKGLEKAALKVGANPSQWRMSYYPVPKEKWIAVERWNPEKQTWEDFKTVTEMSHAAQDRQ